ncbi:MAG: glycosyltransferase [Candidatus Helarchaeota archaeon]
MNSQNLKIKPEISIVIPTFNEESNIKRTLYSIKKQRCNVPFEVFIADGQSTDNTVKIAQKFATVIITPQRGKALQVNYVVPKTSGDILIFLDADTIIPPLFLEKIYNLFKKKKDLFACSARFKYNNGTKFSIKIGNKQFTITTFFFYNWGSYLYYFIRYLFGYPELAGCNIIVRRNIFFKVGGFKNPPKSWGIDKIFTDAILYYIKKTGFGKVKTLSSIHVLTSGRKVSIKRGLERVYQYQTNKELYSNLAKKDIST